jgi:hypothetical protein
MGKRGIVIIVLVLLTAGSLTLVASGTLGP